MSCAPGFPTFRLLDCYVGWDKGDQPFDSPENLIGFDDCEGLRLKPQNPNAVDPGDLLPFIPPARLALGCGPCDWYLLTPTPPDSRLLHRDPCTGDWKPVWAGDCVQESFGNPVAVAAWRHKFAISDRATNKVSIWSGDGARLSARIEVSRPGPIAFTPRGELVVASQARRRWILRRHGPSGDFRRLLPTLPEGRLDRIAVSNDCAIWAIIERAGDLEIWRVAKGSAFFRRATLQDLRAAFDKNSLVAASDRGFCLEQKDANNIPVVCCFNWYGRPLCDETIPGTKPVKLFERGQLLTKAIDSGIPRCGWHRVRVDADVPSGTTLEISVSTSEDETPAPQGDTLNRGVWQNFHAGVPHQNDWQVASLGSLDFLIHHQPPGRYLFLRLRFTGDGNATPVVRRIRLEFPRATSMDLLPTVYRDNPDAEDFSERFLSLFDSAIADLDAAIERYPALLDPTGIPAEVLPWLGTFVDVSFDSAWTTERRRAILKAIPDLYRKRGTPAGLKKAVQLVFDVEPAIQELGAERMWGAIARAKCPDQLQAAARLGRVRLFGRSSARFRLGSSQLSKTPLRSFGNPDRDPLASGAYRFRVLVPPASDRSPIWRERVRRLVESQKPAHTVASMRVGGSGFVLGTWAAVGVDTMFSTVPAPVLNKTQGNIRLNRMSVLWPGRSGLRSGIVAGRSAVVGVKTVME